MKFQVWRLQHRCFPVNIAKFLRTIFFIKHLFIIVFQNFMWWYNSLKVFGYKIDIFYISCVNALFPFITLLESGFHGYSILVFIPELLVNVTFVRITTSAYEFLNIMLCHYFSLEALLQEVAKNNLTENFREKFRRHWSMRQRENLQKGKCKVYR